MRAARRGLVLLVVLGACGRAAQPPVEEETASQALSAMTTALQDAVVRRDAAAIASLFADSAVLHELDGATLTGRQAIEARIMAVLPRLQGYSISSQRLESSGDLAFDAQTFQLTLAVEDGEPRTLAGHQLVILRRQPDRTWKVIRSGAWIAPAAGVHQH
jgi:uncharacterized protein (TIGR02246 family)